MNTLEILMAIPVAIILWVVAGALVYSLGVCLIDIIKGK